MSLNLSYKYRLRKKKEENTMEHSENFDKVKEYYNTIVNGERLWNEARVRNAVVKGWITEEEFNEITGGNY
jgi:Phage uncharacterised protein (Phage_XkdX).